MLVVVIVVFVAVIVMLVSFEWRSMGWSINGLGTLSPNSYCSMYSVFRIFGAVACLRQGSNSVDSRRHATEINTSNFNNNAPAMCVCVRVFNFHGSLFLVNSSSSDINNQLETVSPLNVTHIAYFTWKTNANQFYLIFDLVRMIVSFRDLLYIDMHEYLDWGIMAEIKEISAWKWKPEK